MDVVKGFVEGIVYKSEETGYVVAKINSNNKTITAVGRLGKEGMKETDKEILDIMLEE